MILITRPTHRVAFTIGLLLILTSTSIFSAPVTAKKEGMEITADSKMDASGKTLVTCVLSNHSQHTIAATNLQTHSSAFYFKLLDHAGKEIMQDPEWAKTFAQKSSERYGHPRSFRIDQANPGGKKEFEFYLEDAYGSEGPKGQQMVVSWESGYFGDVIPTSDYTNADGIRVKGSDEKYMFPERWDISVTLPLKSPGGGPDQPSKLTDPDTKQPSSSDLPTSQPPTMEPGKEEARPNSSFQWWWLLAALLVIPAAFAVLRKK